MGSISDHRLAEKTLRESEPFARSVLDSLSANIAVLDESGTIVFSSASTGGREALKALAWGSRYVKS